MNRPSTPLPPALDAALGTAPEAERDALAHAFFRAEPHVTTAGGAPDVLDAERVRTTRAALLRHARAETRGPKARQRRRLLGWSGVVATGAVLVIAGLLWLRPRVLTTPPGVPDLVTLSDGTRVELAGGAMLRVRPLFGLFHRRVGLDGEAFFDVVTDAEPFVVRTADAEVTVLGTRFNVAAPADRPTRVWLEEGRVRLRPLGSAAAVVLAPGEASAVAAGVAGAPEPALEPPQWRLRRFDVRNQRLRQIFDTISRTYGVEVHVDRSVPAGEPLTLRFPTPMSAEALVADLAQMHGLRYRRTPDGFDVLPASSE